MTMPNDPEYRRLVTESSNDIIRWDVRSGVGESPEAALHARQAGFARQRMGAMMVDAGEYVRAASDLLSAAACFYQATDLPRTRICLGQAQQVVGSGGVPAESGHVYAALQEREGQCQELTSRLSGFEAGYAGLGRPAGIPHPPALEYLLGRVRDLPGYPRLHALIGHEAALLGRLDLARQHLEWARTFAPESPFVAALLVGVMVQAGDPVGAAEVGRGALAVHPEVGILRVRVAEATAAAADDRSAGLEEAAGLLRPLVEGPAASELDRFVATSLAATLRYDLGQEAEYRRLKTQFDQLAEAATTPIVAAMAGRLRTALPHIFPLPGASDATRSAPRAAGQMSNRARWGEAFAPMGQLVA